VAGWRVLILLTIISAVVTTSSAWSEEVRWETSYWSAQSPTDAEAYQINIRTSQTGERYQQFSFVFSSDPNSHIGRVNASNKNFTRMQPVIIPGNECYISKFLEHFSFSETNYLLCIDDDFLLAVRLGRNAPDFMPRLLELMRTYTD
jgi:hypothetical protein